MFIVIIALFFLNYYIIIFWYLSPVIFRYVQLAEELIKKETLNYKDVEAILGKPPFAKKFIDPIEFEQNLRNMEHVAKTGDDDVGAASAKPTANNGLH